MNLAFAALLAAATAYFLLRRRSFDLFAVAFGDSTFYFFAAPGWVRARLERGRPPRQSHPAKRCLPSLCNRRAEARTFPSA
jgi:hypothetical protein